MSNFTEKDLEKLAHLCRIACTPEEKDKLLTNLRQILKYVEQLDAIDTQGVPACNHVSEAISHPLRADEVGKVLDRKEFLDNSPAHVGGMIKVPPVISF